MAQLSRNPILAADLTKFVQERSDFAFEMRVAADLRRLAFTCSHAGTYRDPVTDKIRQFDIRAVRTEGHSRLALAVECKNIQENCPLLLSALPRTSAEAFHHLLQNPPQSIRTTVRDMAGQQSFYKPNDMVAKQTDQVGKDTNDRLTSDDQVTFEKMNQAVNSCRDFVREFSVASSPFLTAIVPVLVLPTNLLWQVEYDADGALKKEPAQLSRGALFLDTTWSVEMGALGHVNYRISHLEFVTSDALASWVSSCFAPGGLFPMTG